jgi:hypothetical protein
MNHPKQLIPAVNHDSRTRATLAPVLLLAVVPAPQSTPAGTLYGYILDPDHRPLPGAPGPKQGWARPLLKDRSVERGLLQRLQPSHFRSAYRLHDLSQFGYSTQTLNRQ